MNDKCLLLPTQESTGMKFETTTQQHLMSGLAKGLWNLISANIGWLACILGAARGQHWLGLVVVPILFVIHITLIERHKIVNVFVVALASMGIGFLTDTALIIIGTVEPNRWVMPAPFTTLWDLLIWANFSLTLNSSLGFLQKRPLAAAMLGAICAPWMYYAGDRLGALHFSKPVFHGLLWVGLLWFFVMPCLSFIAMHFYHPQKTISV
jgi:hypothetical protein